MRKFRIFYLKIITLALITVFSGLVMIQSQNVYAQPQYIDLDLYPEAKSIEFEKAPVRENISESNMVDPEYAIKICKTLPDEYFGATVSQVTDSQTGEVINGIKIGSEGVKGECGCIYRNMFRYQGDWIDVKTTYVDWVEQSKKMAFFSGGFARYRWVGVAWMKMDNEFFISGTNTPLEVKGFLIYNDVDNYQGLIFDPNEIGSIWTNSNGSLLEYCNIPANELYEQNILYSYTFSRDMIAIRSKTLDDIDVEGETLYVPSEAAKTDFAITFQASVFHICLTDDDTKGTNLLGVSPKKIVPTSLPKENSTQIKKTVSDNDEIDKMTNSVRNWDDWTYMIQGIAPLETEPGNFFDKFAISDQINPCLSIKSINVKKEGGEDVTDKFNISNENNRVCASATYLDEEDFYGNNYYLEICVGILKEREEMINQNMLDENFSTVLQNTAEVTYGDGNGDINIYTNSTETTVIYETEADVVITKKIKASEIYSKHGKATFLFKLEGQTVSGKEKTFHNQITISEEYANANKNGKGDIFKSVTFDNVPEGEYICSEYETLRFIPYEIVNVSSGGRVEGDTVRFSIDDKTQRTATFVNRRKSWNNYSDSNLIINNIGIGAN